MKNQFQEMNNFLKSITASMKQTDKTLKDAERAIKKREREVVKENKAMIKKVKAMQTKKYKDMTADLNKTIKSYRMKEHHQQKKLDKLNENIKATKQEIEENKLSYITFTFFAILENQDAKEYANYLYKRDDEGTKYINVPLWTSPVLIKNKFLSQYNLRQFYNKTDNTEEFIRDFVELITNADDDAKHTINRYCQSKSIDGFMIFEKRQFDNEANDINLMDIEYMNDANDKKIYSKYTQYKLNLESTDFKDLLTLEHHQYIKTHFRPYSCLLTAIINKFYDRFNRIKSDGKRRNKELTYDYLCGILEIENKPSHNAVSIQRVVDKFFKSFNFVSLYVYTPYMALLYKHEAMDKTDSVCLRIMVKDKHVYQLNDNLKQLQQVVDNRDDERVNISVSDKYFIQEKPQDFKRVFCNDKQEMLNAIKSIDDETKQLCIITTHDMNDVLLELIKTGYSPKIFFNTFVYKINIKTDKVNISIETCDNNPMYGQQVILESLEEYDAYQSAYYQAYESIMNKSHLSDYHSSVIEVEDKYPIRPVFGYLGEKVPGAMNTLDENKAYTECLRSITKVPIFHYFDTYMNYDNHKVEDLTYYIIEVLEETNESIILFGSKYSRTFGYILNATDIKYKILQYRRPLKTDATDYMTPITKLYGNSNVSVDMKKMIINKITGLLEQKTNKGHLTKIFSDYNEANHYSIKYSGKILPIMTNVNKEVEEYSAFDDAIIKSITSDFETHCYLVNVHEEKRLKNGFSPIKDMVYLNQRLKLVKLYKEMTGLGLVIAGCKTDCLYYIGSDRVVKSHFPLSKQIGDYKIEENKYLPDTKLQLQQNDFFAITDYSKVEIKTFVDEKNTKDINAFISKHKRLLIKGEYPGVGKSTMCKKFDKDALFILPYNRLCQNLKTEGHEAITYSRAFGLFKDDVELKNIKSYDLSEFDTIVFDEALLYTPDRLKRLDKLMEMYPSKTFLSTGDTDQRNPIGFDNEQYLTHCMNVIFRNQVILKDIKRLVNVADIQRWKDLKTDIFNSDVSIQDICKKHKINTVRNLNDVKTTKNICYFNFRCDMINSYVHKDILKHQEQYYSGLEIVCRKYEKCRQYTINTNYVYKIKSIKSSGVVITDEIENLDYTIPKGMLHTHFKHPYSLTCDSVQGISFDENDKITIFDSNLPYTDRKYLWTAITRCRKLDNVTIFIHSDTEVERFTSSRISQYFRFKVDNYKQQDKKACREWILTDYIDDKWIQAEINVYGMICRGCKKPMELYVNNEGIVQSNLTVDRLDNTKAHLKNNCQLLCLHCNVCKK